MDAELRAALDKVKAMRATSRGLVGTLYPNVSADQLQEFLLASVERWPDFMCHVKREYMEERHGR